MLSCSLTVTRALLLDVCTHAQIALFSIWIFCEHGRALNGGYVKLHARTSLYRYLPPIASGLGASACPPTPAAPAISLLLCATRQRRTVGHTGSPGPVRERGPRTRRVAHHHPGSRVRRDAVDPRVLRRVHVYVFTSMRRCITRAIGVPPTSLRRHADATACGVIRRSCSSTQQGTGEPRLAAAVRTPCRVVCSC